MKKGIQLFNMAGRVALITGGSKGLGLAMAEGLASAGAKLALLSRHGNESVAAAEQVTKEFGVEAIGLTADVTSQTDVENSVQTCIGKFGRIDILINNAGINIRGPIDELSPADFQKVMATNVDGLWLASRAVVPFMKKQKYGRIINLASTLGIVGLANRTPYASSKGAVVQMTRALALELAPFQITVNAICPGPFLTDMNIPIRDDENTKKFILGQVALERWGELHEIQGVAIYLASEASSYTTGSLMVVDGGWTAR